MLAIAQPTTRPMLCYAHIGIAYAYNRYRANDQQPCNYTVMAGHGAMTIPRSWS
jgi:hypothetical protein